MSNHFSMGAINKITNDYEYPKIATKGINKYKCPCCDKDVIFKKGLIKKPHFAHYKSTNPCFYYDKPSESQIHKDAKMLMKSLLDNKKNICINRECNYCEQRNCGCVENVHYDICDEYNENTKAIIEYKFIHNNSKKSADLALVENDTIKYIFEICYKNKTNEENRPEPWAEINAEDLINKINSGEIIDEDGNISIKCIRNYKCRFCIEYEENETKKMNLYYENIRQEQIEKERIEREKLEKEKIRKQEEYEGWREREKERIREREEKRIREQEEERKKITHKCGLMIMNICICENPKYEIVKLSNNLFCVICDKWKCRCN
jgi:hypothetical protein